MPQRAGRICWPRGPTGPRSWPTIRLPRPTTALRPPVGQDRLQLMPDGTAVLELRRRWTDGTTHLVFEPVELLERLAALTPRPRINRSEVRRAMTRGDDKAWSAPTERHRWARNVPAVACLEERPGQRWVRERAFR